MKLGWGHFRNTDSSRISATCSETSDGSMPATDSGRLRKLIPAERPKLIASGAVSQPSQEDVQESGHPSEVQVHLQSVGIPWEARFANEDDRTPARHRAGMSARMWQTLPATASMLGATCFSGAPCGSRPWTLHSCTLRSRTRRRRGSPRRTGTRPQRTSTGSDNRTGTGNRCRPRKRRHSTISSRETPFRALTSLSTRRSLAAGRAARIGRSG